MAAICTLNLSAQQAGLGPTPMLSPVPIVTAGAIIPSDSKQYVFLGPKISELTISYPSDLEVGGGVGPRRTFTVKILNQVRPIVSTTVTEQQDGTFEYVYAIRNDSNARDAIKVLALALPATDALLSPATTPWSAKSESARGHENALPGAASMTPVMFSTWRDSTGSGIAPGQLITNIRIRSAYRPGLTLLYARSNEDYDVKADLPAAVKAQVDVMRAPEWQNQAAIVIGPVYPKTLPRDFVANELSHGVARLTSAGQLNESSPAVAAIKKFLESVSRSGGVGAPVDQLRSVAQTASESELINAVMLSLR
jgi:hypothetical protein